MEGYGQVEGAPAGVHIQDGAAVLQGGQAKVDLPIKSARAPQRWVHCFRPVQAPPSSCAGFLGLCKSP